MSNIFKTSILLAGMTALLGWIGMMLGGQTGMMIALVFAGAMNIGSWWFSDKIVLSMYGAQPVESGRVYDMVRDLAVRANLPMPKVYIINDPTPNAFATGRNPENAAVAVNSGIMNILDERELRGVIAHELAHIKNRDTLTMTVTATIAGAISMLANFAMFFGGGRSNDENGENRGHPIVSILIMFLAPLAASLVQMALSRVREYSADRDGAEICGDPMALASALQKIEIAAHRGFNPVAEQNPATASMFIINPLSGRGMDNLFSTHPKTENRVTELEKYASEHGIAGKYKPADTSDNSRNPWG